MFEGFRRKVLLSVALLVGTIAFGVLGYVLLEGMALTDAFYMTMITISTVGFGEVVPLSDVGRAFTVVFIFLMLVLFTYAIGTISSFLLDGEFQKYLRRRRMQKTIDAMKDHVVVCGYGRNGRQACMELFQYRIPFVVIEQEFPPRVDLQTKEGMALTGDATNDEMLEQAGIQRAKALISTLPDDADNVFVVLTAREMNPDLRIISRASAESTERKLKIAGANNVIMPDRVGGSQMASLIIKPDVMEFIDVMVGHKVDDVQIDELDLRAVQQKFKGKTISELDIRRKCGANIIGLKLTSGEYVVNPRPDVPLEAECKILVLGTREQIAEMQRVYMS